MQAPNSAAFRAEAVQQGLVYPTREAALANQPCFLLTLTDGMLYAAPTAENTRKLVQLARKHAVSEGLGEHNELLKLALKRETLSDPGFVYWRGDFTVHSDQDRWLRLGEWLAEQKQAYVPAQRQFSAEVGGKVSTANVSEETYQIFMDGLALRRYLTIRGTLAHVVKTYGELTEDTIRKFMDEQWVL